MNENLVIQMKTMILMSTEIHRIAPDVSPSATPVCQHSDIRSTSTTSSADVILSEISRLHVCSVHSTSRFQFNTESRRSQGYNIAFDDRRSGNIRNKSTIYGAARPPSQNLSQPRAVSLHECCTDAIDN